MVRVLLIISLVFLVFLTHGAPVPDESDKAALSKADSLFHLKQYTQSFEIYQALFQSKRYSTSMLLKMAYIQEGLGHLAQSMYYLDLYYLITNDQQARSKMADMAAKNRLEGYDFSDTSRLLHLLREYNAPISISISALCIFLASLSFYMKFRKRLKPVLPLAFMFVLLLALGAQSYFTSQPYQGIVARSSTYLMEGPSAGSSVVSIVGEGHKLDIVGKKDVWAEVEWANRKAFVREADLMVVGI